MAIFRAQFLWGVTCDLTKFDSLLFGLHSVTQADELKQKYWYWNKNLVHEYFQINIADMNKLIQPGRILRFKI